MRRANGRPPRNDAASSRLRATRRGDNYLDVFVSGNMAALAIIG